MEGRLYLRLLRRNWVLLVITTLIAFGLAVLAYASATPSYRTELSFLVEASQGKSPSQAYQGGLLAQARAPVYKQLVTSDPVIERVGDATNSPQSVEDLKTQFTTSLEPGSTLIEVSADAETAADSLELANAMADVYPTYVGGLNATVGAAASVRVLDAPTTTEQVAPLHTRYAAIAVLLALFLGIVAIAIRESTNRKVRDTDDLRNLIPQQVVVARFPGAGQLSPPGFHQSWRRLQTAIAFCWPWTRDTHTRATSWISAAKSEIPSPSSSPISAATASHPSGLRLRSYRSTRKAPTSTAESRTFDERASWFAHSGPQPAAE